MRARRALTVAAWDGLTRAGYRTPVRCATVCLYFGAGADRLLESRPVSARVRTATIAGGLTVASAVGGAFAAGASPPLALALIVIAVVLGGTAAIALLATLRKSRRRRAARRTDRESPLSRLDYVPSVTSRAPRLRWRGSRYWSIGRRGRLAHLRLPEERELVGSRARSAPRSGSPEVAEGGVTDGGEEGAPVEEEADPGG